MNEIMLEIEIFIYEIRFLARGLSAVLKIKTTRDEKKIAKISPFL
jgi:hypothetical protein